MPSKSPTAKPRTDWGYTLTELADAFGHLTGEPIGSDGIIDAIEAGLLDEFVIPTQLAKGRLRFDPSICLWTLAAAELAVLAARGTLTQAESEAVLRQITPTMPDAFLRAAQWCACYKRKLPAETRVFATVKSAGGTKKRVTLNYLARGLQLLRSV